MKKMTKEELKTIIEPELCKEFTTGFLELDYFLSNIKGGDIITIGARPAMGKTSFAISILNHLLDKNKTVAYFSFEMTKELLAKRILASKAQVQTFLPKEKQNEIYFKKLKDVLTWFANKNCYINDKLLLSVEEIEEEIVQLKPDIVFIDYIQLVKMPKAPNMTEAINYAIQEIKRIAKENNTVVILLSQVSRAVETRCDKRPMLSDLRNSSTLEELSDIVLFIYRDEYYNAIIENDLEKNLAQIIVGKNKLGTTGTVYLKFVDGYFKNCMKDDNVLKVF